jgi:hypothetical protein
VQPVEPDVSEKVPGGQLVQEEAPVSEKSPAEQDVQAALVGRPVPDWKVPARQDWQVLDVTAPLAVEYTPVEQAVQAALACRPVPVE